MSGTSERNGQTPSADAAAEAYARAVEQDPTNVAAHCGLGDALYALGRSEEAAAHYARAVALDPARWEAHSGLANARRRLGDFEGALASEDAAIALSPESWHLHFNRGNLLVQLHRLEEAAASYGRAAELQPGAAIARHARAVALLQMGHVEDGFREFEWRKACADYQDERYRLKPQLTPGVDLAGRRLFIYPERFLGDMVQFCRYARVAERQGAEVVLAAPRSLHRLLGSLSPTVTLIDREATPERFDYASALMSLPMALPEAGTAGGEAPYLQADPERVAHWREVIGERGFRIGVCWQGSTAPYSIPLQRSFPAAALAPIAALPGVRLISLQKHDGLEQLAELPAGMAIETLGAGLDAGPDAFVDTAAAIMACDLVISADTSVAHVAGAVGARTWVALPYQSEWRWLLDRADSPWYPSLRLFRQPTQGDWGAVFAEMAAALSAERSA